MFGLKCGVKSSTLGVGLELKRHPRKEEEPHEEGELLPARTVPCLSILMAEWVLIACTAGNTAHTALHTTLPAQNIVSAERGVHYHKQRMAQHAW